jgi:hypothetical protein
MAMNVAMLPKYRHGCASSSTNSSLAKRVATPDFYCKMQNAVSGTMLETAGAVEAVA